MTYSSGSLILASDYNSFAAAKNAGIFFLKIGPAPDRARWFLTHPGLFAPTAL